MVNVQEAHTTRLAGNPSYIRFIASEPERIFCSNAKSLFVTVNAYTEVIGQDTQEDAETLADALESEDGGASSTLVQYRDLTQATPSFISQPSSHFKLC